MLAASLRSNHLRPALEPSVSPLVLDWELAFERAPTKQAFAYWQSLCKGRITPRRRELSPMRMRPFLTHVNLVDIARAYGGAQPDYIMALQGQHSRDIYGEVAHRKLHEALPPHIVQRWLYAFGHVLEAARPARFFSSISTGGDSCLKGEALIAPLGDEDGGIGSLFVVLATWLSRETAG